MEKFHLLEQAEIIAREAWEMREHSPVDALRGESERRILHVLPWQASQFDSILRGHIELEKAYLTGSTVEEGLAELEQLQGIGKALGKRKVIDRNVSNGRPRLEAVVLSGHQISLIHDFLENYPFSQDEESYPRERDHMKYFSNGLIKDYQTSPIATEGRVGGIIKKLTRQR